MAQHRQPVVGCPAAGLDHHGTALAAQQRHRLRFPQAGEIHHSIRQLLQVPGAGFAAAVAEGQHQLKATAIEATQQRLKKAAHGMVSDVARKQQQPDRCVGGQGLGGHRSPWREGRHDRGWEAGPELFCFGANALALLAAAEQFGEDQRTASLVGARLQLQRLPVGVDRCLGLPLPRPHPAAAVMGFRQARI